MLTIIATVLAGLIGAGIFFIGVFGMLKPKNAVGFGIPDTRPEDPALRAWLMVKANRDIGSGLFFFVLIANGSTPLLGWAMLAATFMPVCDAVTVLRSKGPKATAYGVHGATAAAMLVISALLFLA